MLKKVISGGEKLRLFIKIMPKNAMKSLKNILARKNIGGEAVVDEKSVESVFFEILREETPNIGRADVRNFRMGDKVIFLRTVHPAVASEIWRRKEKLKRKINDLLGSEIIEDMKIK